MSHRHRAFFSPRGRRAAVLLMTLLSLALLSVVVGEMVYVSSLSRSVSEERVFRTKAHLSLLSGLGAARQLLLEASSDAAGVAPGSPRIGDASFEVNGGRVEAAVYSGAVVCGEVASGRGTDLGLLTGLRREVSLAGFERHAMTGRLNVNLAPPSWLNERLSDVNDAVVREIVRRRDGRPFRSLDELKEVPGVTPELYRRLAQDLDVNDHVFLAVVCFVDARGRSFLASLMTVKDETVVPAAVALVD